MNFSGYLAARNTVTDIGQPLFFLTFALSAILVVFTLYQPLRQYARHLILGIFLSLLAGFLLLGWFHYQIYQYLPLANPINGEIVGRYAIPLWIEDEKLYFWTFLIALWLVIMRKRTGGFQIALNLTLTAFVTLTVLTSNPFIAPLSNFNSEIAGYSRVLASQDLNVKMQAFGATAGQMQGYYNSSYMWIHPPLLFLAYSTFVISFFGAVFMLIKRDHEFDKIAYQWAKPGYIVLTIGLLLGYPWAVDAWKGQPWWYSPKINVTLMMWVLYTAYLHSRLYLHRRGMWHTSAILGILGFTAVIATYLSTYVLPGIHSVGGPR